MCSGALDAVRPRRVVTSVALITVAIAGLVQLHRRYSTTNTCAYVLRGPLYKQKHAPKKGAATSAFDLSQLWWTHENMIKQLSSTYRRVDVYFISFTDTPAELRSWARWHGRLILLPPEKSWSKTISQGMASTSHASGARLSHDPGLIYVGRGCST